jgi:hypothetical protein
LSEEQHGIGSFDGNGISRRKGSLIVCQKQQPNDTKPPPSPMYGPTQHWLNSCNRRVRIPDQQSVFVTELLQNSYI